MSPCSKELLTRLSSFDLDKRAAFSMAFGWSKDCKTAEDPASAMHTNRVIQTAFSEKHGSSFLWELGPAMEQKQKPVAGYLNLLRIRSRIVFSVNAASDPLSVPSLLAKRSIHIPAASRTRPRQGDPVLSGPLLSAPAS